MKVIIYLLLIINTLIATQKETITWLVNDAPPFYILNGSLKDGGIGDMTQKLIINDLKQYNHEIKKTTLKRAMKDFKYNKKVCFSTWIYNSTPDLVITSNPNIYYPPLGIITTSKNKKLLKEKVLSLDKLLQNKKFVFGKAKGRGYGEPLDSIVNKYKNQKNFKIRNSSTHSTKGIFEMIKRERIDYTIDYYSSLVYSQLGKINRGDKLVFIPILETKNEGVLGSIACSKTPWGEKVISDINISIDKIKYKNQYMQILNEWLVPIDDKGAYWEKYERKIKNFK